MNTYPISDKAGQTFAFEIDNAYLGRTTAASILLSVDGVRSVRAKKVFESPNDVQVAFVYKGREFIVWEPYADSSRFWIGPKEESQERVEISAIEEAFRNYRPPFARKVLGDLFSLKFLSIIGRWFKSGNKT